MTVFVIGAPTGVAVATGHLFLFDFRGDLYDAGRAILHGLDPYRPGLLAAQAATLRAGGTIALVASPRYPPPVLLAAVPLSLLPLKVAGIAFAVASMGAVVLALRLLGVRDWRCIAVACLSEPVQAGVTRGDLAPLLLLGLACAWRWRSRTTSGALVTATTVVAKLWLWPLYPWLLITKRWREAALALLLAVGVLLGSWAVIGFAGMASYPHLLANASYLGEVRSGSIAGGLLALGLSARLSQLGAVLIAALPMAFAWRLARGPDGERQAFGLILVAALIASPVVWDQYLIVLFVPIALLAPRLSWLWLVPSLAAFGGKMTSRPVLWHCLPDLLAELIVVGWISLPLLRSETSKDQEARPTAVNALIGDPA